MDGRIFKAAGRKIQILREGNSKPGEAKSKLLSSANRDYSRACGWQFGFARSPPRLGRVRRARVPALSRQRAWNRKDGLPPATPRHTDCGAPALREEPSRNPCPPRFKAARG